MEITFIIILFIVLIIIGMPIAYSLAIPCTLYFIFFEPQLKSIIPIRIFSGIDQYSLIALPLYIIMGKLMGSGGITKMIIEVSLFIFGRIKGGLALVNVFASMIFGGISGSSMADTASIGVILIPEMIKKKYEPKISVGVTVASSSVGMIIPPSIPMIIYSMASYVSVEKLFLAGAIPGVTIALLQLVISYFLGKKNNWPIDETKVSKKEKFITTFKALPALLMPLFILGGIVFGITTATEAAALGILYAIICGFLIYRELNLKEILKIIKESMYISVSVMIIVTFSNVLGWILITEGVHIAVEKFIFGLNLPIYVISLLFGVFLIIIGMFLDAGIAILLVTPIFLPAMMNIGMDPIAFGSILIVGLAIGLVTPPVGSCLSIACKISNLNMITIFIASTPWLIANVIVLILVCIFPQISLFLPRLLD